MAWSNSKIFREWVGGPMFQSSGTSYTGIDSDTIKAALFNNSVTPDQDAAVGSTGYNTGTWTTSNEVTDTNWPAGGNALASKTFNTGTSATAFFDAADTTHSGTVTLANVYGCLLYDDTITGGTVADQGISFHYFGGVQSVTAGNFTIIWSASGIVRFSL